jgi:dihydrolipoamide dehydrogenase
MSKKTIKADVAVIGAGPGGGAAAEKTARGGLATVLIDKSEVGGTCLNRGCVPSKVWLAASHLNRMNSLAKKLGTSIPPPLFPEIKRKHQDVVSIMRKGLQSTYKKSGIEYITGEAVFRSEKRIEIDNGEYEVEFDHAVIATGSLPVNPFGESVKTSDSIFGLESLPSSIMIIGGGAIGIEMATFFSDMGTDVAVVEEMEDILMPVDADIRNVVKRELKKSGVRFVTGSRVESINERGGQKEIVLSNGETFLTDEVLVSIGRKAGTARLNLDNVGIETGRNGFIKVDSEMRSTQKNIFAVGDAAGRGMLAYTAHHEGVTAARNILGKEGAVNIDYGNIPIIIYSNPEIGFVGKTEMKLKDEGTPYDKGEYFIRALARAHASDEIAGTVKILAGKDGKLLGIHIAAPQATELIHAGVVAMNAGMKVEELAGTIFGHPTLSEAIALAAEELLKGKG